MTRFELALDYSTGLETSVEELSEAVGNHDLGINATDDFDYTDEELDELYEKFQVDARITNHGHGAKYFY